MQGSLGFEDDPHLQVERANGTSADAEADVAEPNTPPVRESSTLIAELKEELRITKVPLNLPEFL